MKYLITALSLVLSSVVGFAQGTIQSGSFTAKPNAIGFNSIPDYKPFMFSKDYSNLPFRLLEPKNYIQNANTLYPLVVMLHGRGEAGYVDNNNGDNEMQLKWGGKKHLDARNDGRLPAFVLFPQEPYGVWATGNTHDTASSNQLQLPYLKMVWDLVDLLASQYKIDRNRVIIHGLSSGGTGTLASIYHRPDLFAAALPMSAAATNLGADEGGVEFSMRRNMGIMAPVSVWWFQGGIDDNPRVGITDRAFQYLKDSGATNMNRTKYTMYPNAGHYVWDAAYDNAGFFSFMMQQNKRKIYVMGNNPICCGVGTSLAFSKGFYQYQWFKDGVAIAGANKHKITNITAGGTYYVQYKRRGSNELLTSEAVDLTGGGANIKPTVSFTLPVNNSIYTLPANVNLTAVANDPDGSVTKVEFYQNGNLLFSDANSPYSYNWTVLSGGDYVLKAVATDNQGGVAESETAISVGISQPTGGGLTATYFNNKTLSGSPTLTRVDGPVNFKWLASPGPGINNDNFSVRWQGKIQPQFSGTYTFYVRSDDGERLKINGVQVTDDWSDHGSNEKSGSLTLTAGQKYDIVLEFYDACCDGEIALLWSSANLPKQVIPYSNLFPLEGDANQAPTVSLSSPSNGGSYLLPASIILTANANDLDGSISKVEFFQNGNLLFSDIVSPYTYTWSVVSASTYTLNAVATDNLGKVAQSDPVTVVTNTVPQNGSGLTGTYYNNKTLSGSPVATRVDVNVNFLWNGSPAPGVTQDNFSVKWSGKIQPQFSGLYTFYVKSDDGERLYINGALITNDWSDHATNEKSGTISLVAGTKYDIVLEFYDACCTGEVSLLWSHASVAKQVVPSANLFPLEGGTPPPASTGTGLTASYFNNKTLTGTPIATQLTSMVDFLWLGSPVPGVNQDDFSVRWTGQVEAQYSGTYTFYVKSDDGERLFVNGIQLTNDWNNHGTEERIGTISLAAGQKYNIVLEYYDACCTGEVSLWWSHASLPKQLIPSTSLFPSVSGREDRSFEDLNLSFELTKTVVYPQPAYEILHLAYPSAALGTINVSLVDNLSRVRMSESTKVQKGNNLLNFDIGDLSPGIYIVTIRSDEKVEALKIVIE